MDPLTALALAGNVLQFVEFVGGLFKNTCKIYASTSGLTPENRHLQDICDKLGSFSTRLQCRSSISKGAPLSENSQTLEECTAACKKDCDELLRIMRALAAKGIKGPKYWRSFSAALAHTLKSCDIQDLKTRIADRQRLMVLQLCAVSNENIQVISSQLQQLRLSISQWNTRNDTWLDKLADTERSLKNQVNRLARHESLHPDDIQSVCSGLTQLSIDTGDYQKAINILNTLDYEERPVRHSKIPDAHQVTFAWTLNETDATGKTAGFFRRWLIGDDGLFWVSGKPGSGKSTFMKFVAGHPDTRQFLQQWAGDRDLIVASHYFTIYGTEIQKSLEGLLRSLLYDILKGEPKLIEKFLPSRWKATIEQRPWTQHELDAVLRRITAESSFPVNMCFFIDGLDEYTGDHLDICQTLREISQSPFIKVCVSSRPWNVFEDALGDTPSLKLYMHDLTHNDIRDFTEHRLREHPRWKAFVEEANITTSDSLIEDVVDKSKGVFLWVFLVTRLLREGLNNDDSIQDLKRRVSSYPTDLEKFFKHILESVDPFYHEKMAGTLMLARDAKSSSLPVEIFMFHDLEYEDEDYAFKESTEPPHLPSRGEDYHKLILSISRRINGRCKGLLERCRRHMVFLHRTVFDFLRTPEMTAFLEEKAKKNFNPGLSLLQSSIAWMKRSRFDLHDLEYTTTSRRSYHFKESLEMILNYASLLEEESGSTAARVSALLDNLDSSIAKMSERGQIAREDKSIAVGMYRHQLLENGLHEYLQAKLASVPGYFNNEYADKDKSPLRFVLCHAPEYLAPYRTLLEMLLQNGCDPNRSHDKETPWTRCLKVYCRIKPPCDFFAALDTGIFEFYLQHGADPNALLDAEDCQGQTVQIPAWFEFFRVAPHVKAEFQQAYERVLDVLLSDISLLHTSRHCDTNSSNRCELCQHNFQLAHPMAMPDTLPDKGEFLFRVFEKAVARTRRNQCAFDTCWFTECLSHINKDIENKPLVETLEQGRINSRKRLLEEELQPHKIIKTVRER